MVVIVEDVERNIESVMEDVGDGNTKLQLNYLQLASQLLEMLQNATTRKGDGADDRALTEILEFAANEFGIEREEQRESKLKVYSRKKAKLENAEEPHCDQLIKLNTQISMCDHFCCDHKQLGTMHLDIWSSMPSDLLHLVFIHLPVDEISRLRVLNKEWMQIMSNPDSEFYQHCDAVKPKMMCLLTKDSLTPNKFWVRVCDLKRGTWRSYEIFVGYPEYLTWTLACEDEGLVCFVTHLNVVSWKRDANPTVFLNVVNPLKIVLYEIPPLVNMRGSIFQMKVDRTTKEFQVFVVAKRLQWSGSMWSENNGDYTVQIFDSVTKEWSQWTPAQQLPDLVSGLRDKHTFAIYDCANRRFVDLAATDNNPWRGDFVGSAFYHDRIFMLRMGNDGPPNFDAAHANRYKVIFFIEEWQYCQVRGDRHSWSKTHVHRCNPFERPPKNPSHYFMRLFTCKGLLMVFAELTPFHAQGRFTNKHLAWLYNLSTRTWSAIDLPKLPEIKRAYSDDSYDPTYSVQMICEPHWTV